MRTVEANQTSDDLRKALSAERERAKALVESLHSEISNLEKVYCSHCNSDMGIHLKGCPIGKMKSLLNTYKNGVQS